MSPRRLPPTPGSGSGSRKHKRKGPVEAPFDTSVIMDGSEVSRQHDDVDIVDDGHRVGTYDEDEDEQVQVPVQQLELKGGGGDGDGMIEDAPASDAPLGVFGLQGQLWSARGKSQSAPLKKRKKEDDDEDDDAENNGMREQQIWSGGDNFDMSHSAGGFDDDDETHEAHIAQEVALYQLDTPDHYDMQMVRRSNASARAATSQDQVNAALSKLDSRPNNHPPPSQPSQPSQSITRFARAISSSSWALASFLPRAIRATAPASPHNSRHEQQQQQQQQQDKNNSNDEHEQLIIDDDAVTKSNIMQVNALFQQDLARLQAAYDASTTTLACLGHDSFHARSTLAQQVEDREATDDLLHREMELRAAEARCVLFADLSQRYRLANQSPQGQRRGAATAIITEAEATAMRNNTMDEQSQEDGDDDEQGQQQQEEVDQKEELDPYDERLRNARREREKARDAFHAASARLAHAKQSLSTLRRQTASLVHEAEGRLDRAAKRRKTVEEWI